MSSVLPRVFVFRLSLDDPHPIPWIRVKLSCAIGPSALSSPAMGEARHTVGIVLSARGIGRPDGGSYSRFSKRRCRVSWRCWSTIVRALCAANRWARSWQTEQRQPARLSNYWRAWRRSPAKMGKASPSLAFAVIGQAKSDGQITPEEESSLLAKLAYALGAA